MGKVFFTADTHIFHKNILKHCPERLNQIGIGELDDEAMSLHDQWLIDTWNKKVGKHDVVYIVGDFSFANVEWTQKIMGKLNGKKFIILGNHDKTCSKVEMQNYFVQVTQMKAVVFRKDQWDFLDEDFQVFLCHYPMITWPSKHYGCVEAHGHCHGRLDDYNEASTDLRVDVGIDGKLANFSLISLEELYCYFKNKTKGEKFSKYASDKKEENTMII